MASALDKFLVSLGIKGKEQEVYLALLGLGDAPAGLVAKKAKTKRTTTYHLLKNLLEKGVASSYKEQGVRRFVAENPRKLKTSLESRLLAVDKYLPQLEAFYDVPRAGAQVRFFESEEGVRQIAEEALMTEEKVIYSIGSIKVAKEASGTSIRFGKRRTALDIESRALRLLEEKKDFPPDYFKRQKEELREVRFLPQDIDVSLMFLIFDDKVGIIAPKEEDFGFIVESEAFSRTMKSLFSMLWTMSSKT